MKFKEKLYRILQIQTNQSAELGKDPIGITVSLSLGPHNFEGLAFDNRPERNLIEYFDSVSCTKFFTSFVLTFGFLIDLGLSSTPHGQVAIFLKHVLW